MLNKREAIEEGLLDVLDIEMFDHHEPDGWKRPSQRVTNLSKTVQDAGGLKFNVAQSPEMAKRAQGQIDFEDDDADWHLQEDDWYDHYDEDYYWDEYEWMGEYDLHESGYYDDYYDDDYGYDVACRWRDPDLDVDPFIQAPDGHVFWRIVGFDDWLLGTVNEFIQCISSGVWSIRDHATELDWNTAYTPWKDLP